MPGEPQFRVINQVTDFTKPPTPIRHFSYPLYPESTIGDLHANFLKLFHFLLEMNIIQLKNGKNSYKKIYNLYIGRNPAKFTKESYKDFMQIFGKEIKFNDVNVHTPLIRMIGDVFSDRGNSDLMTSHLLNLMHQNNIEFEILFSNHDYEFVKNYLNFKKSGTWQNYNNEQYHSSNDFVYAIDKNEIKPESIHDFVNQIYLPNLKLVSYTLLPKTIKNGVENQDIIIYTHAPIPLFALQKLAIQFGFDFSEKVCELDKLDAKALAKLIDEINTKFQQFITNCEIIEIEENHKVLFDPVTNIQFDDRHFAKFLKPATRETEDPVASPFEGIIGNRNQNACLNTEYEIKNGEIYYSFGHTDTEKLDQERHKNLDNEALKYPIDPKNPPNNFKSPLLVVDNSEIPLSRLMRKREGKLIRSVHKELLTINESEKGNKLSGYTSVFDLLQKEMKAKNLRIDEVVTILDEALKNITYDDDINKSDRIKNNIKNNIIHSLKKYPQIKKENNQSESNQTILMKIIANLNEDPIPHYALIYKAMKNDKFDKKIIHTLKIWDEILYSIQQNPFELDELNVKINQYNMTLEEKLFTLNQVLNTIRERGGSINEYQHAIANFQELCRMILNDDIKNNHMQQQSNFLENLMRYPDIKNLIDWIPDEHERPEPLPQEITEKIKQDAMDMEQKANSTLDESENLSQGEPSSTPDKEKNDNASITSSQKVTQPDMVNAANQTTPLSKPNPTLQEALDKLMVDLEG